MNNFDTQIRFENLIFFVDFSPNQKVKSELKKERYSIALNESELVGAKVKNRNEYIEISNL
jgi:hypothetical protein